MKLNIIQDDLTFISTYAPNREAVKFVKQHLIALRRYIDNSKMVVKECNTPLHQWTDLPDRTPVRKQEP